MSLANQKEMSRINQPHVLKAVLIRSAADQALANAKGSVAKPDPVGGRIIPGRAQEAAQYPSLQLFKDYQTLLSGIKTPNR